jgi:Ca2+-binding RTX toxin-like protein
MATVLDTILAGVRADRGLLANISAADMRGGIAAGNDMNVVLLEMIDQINANDDGRIDAADMQGVSDALWERKNAAPWRDFFVGHGNDNGDVETGFHLVQGDGATLQFQGRNFVDTVADAIYHFGFRISEGRYANEDGNDNELIVDVAGWLNFFLNGENIVYGSGSSDEIGSGEYSDYFAAARNETFLAGRGDDSIWADRGSDRVYGGMGNDISGAGTGYDRMYGGAGNDTLMGDEGNDRLFGGYHKDQLGGGEGDDQLQGDGGMDLIYADVGNDTVFGGDDGDKVHGQDGNDRVYGGAGWDEVTGGDGADRLFGGYGNDTLSGGNGRDVITGGKGRDQIYLWEDAKAADTIVFTPGSSGKTVTTMDRVEGFEGGMDKIDMSAFGDMVFKWLDFEGGGQASCYFDGDYLRIDTNGDGANDMMVEFVYMDVLRPGDFIFA